MHIGMRLVVRLNAKHNKWNNFCKNVSIHNRKKETHHSLSDDESSSMSGSSSDTSESTTSESNLTFGQLYSTSSCDYTTGESWSLTHFDALIPNLFVLARLDVGFCFYEP